VPASGPIVSMTYREHLSRMRSDGDHHMEIFSVATTTDDEKASSTSIWWLSTNWIAHQKARKCDNRKSTENLMDEDLLIFCEDLIGPCANEIGQFFPRGALSCKARHCDCMLSVRLSVRPSIYPSLRL